MNSQEKVLEMVAGGRVTSAEGEQLLSAMRTRTGSRWSALLDPFDRLGTPRSTVVAVLALLTGLWLSQHGVRFDGALDMHLGRSAVPWLTAVRDALAGYAVAPLVLWLSARSLNRHVRLVDVFAAVGVSRVPLVLVAALLRFTQAGSVATVAIALVLVAWQLTWLVRGFRTASGLRGGKLTLACALGIVVAEVLGLLVARA